MSNIYLLLTPILMLGVLALVRFVGCQIPFPAQGFDPLPPPQNVTATPGNQSVTLTWDPLEDADAYLIKQGEVANEPNPIGDVGMVIQVGPLPLAVVGLGRIFITGNAGTHTLRIGDSVNGVTLPGANVTIDLAASPGATDHGFVYAILPAPVMLAANTEFYVFTSEIDNGDQWFDQDTTVSTTADATVTNAVSPLGGTFIRSGGPGHAFGPVDVLYS
jgi:hypothetical protein